MRHEFLIGCAVLLVLYLLSFMFFPWFLWTLLLSGPLMALGIYDCLQNQRTILKNFPLLGHFRYLFEAIRPEISQYFIETNTSGRPLNREERSVVYQRAKGQLDTLPFGTQMDVYNPGYEWVNHSMLTTHVDPKSLRVMVGGRACKHPYNASLLNISAMSFGSLSKNAIMALNGGARKGNFAHNTGEGGLSPYHLEPGGDLIWQIGTGYFGCRAADGGFDASRYQDNAQRPEVKMIELKISQGAKPGHGGILPAKKVTEEISKIRGVPMGKDVLSPPMHRAFSTPIEMMEFIAKLRDLSDGKPVGFKLCIGKRREFFAICKAMLETQIFPDYIAIDGGEGGTGAAPLEFSNSIGTPAIDGLIFAHNALTGFGIRKEMRLMASGKVSSAFSIIKLLSLGADLVYSARAMMLALGCIQALRCNSNVCPAGVATQDPMLMKGLNVTDKRRRVAHFHEQTLEAVAEMLGAMGVEHSIELRPWHILRRVRMNEIKNYSELYHYVEPGEFLHEPLSTDYARAIRASSAQTFQHVS